MSRHVRPLLRDDLPRLAALFVKIFRAGRDVDARAVAARLGRAYFDNPWATEDIPSLVYDDGKSLAGFLGVVPRPMRLGGRNVTAAVTGNLMVEPGRAGAFASLQLSRTCVRGPQDLTITDSGRDETRRIAERSGGVTARAYSLQFERRIAPLSFVGHELLRWRRPPLWRRVAPVLEHADSFVASRLRKGPYRRYDNGCVVETLAVDQLAESLSNLPDYTLQPSYSTGGLRWSLETPPRNGAEMRIRRVVDPQGREAGVFAYYLEPGMPCDVVLLAGASPRQVLEALVDDAFDGGARSVWGRADPKQLLDLTACRCVLGAQTWVLVHSDDPELLEPFLRGDAFFPTLDGERWSMRFVDEPVAG